MTPRSFYGGDLIRDLEMEEQRLGAGKYVLSWESM